MQTHTNGRVTAGSRTSNGENDGRIVVLPLVADQSDEAKANKLCCHLCGFLSPYNGRKVAKPLERRDGGKTIFVYDSLFAQERLCFFLYVHELHAFGSLVVLLKSVLRCDGILRRVVGLASDETTKEGSDYGLRDNDLVIG